jgi:hypothetical protein
MNALDLRELNGKLVLVCSAQDYRNPPTGRRGTIFVQEATNGRQQVEVEIEFPQMFTTPAHVRRAILSDDEVAQMLASEHYGAFTVTLKDRLDPVAPAGNE